MCGKVPLRETGEMGPSAGGAVVEIAGGEMGVEVVMFAV